MSDDHLHELEGQIHRDAAVGLLLFCGGLFVGLGIGALMFMLGRWTA